METYSVLFIDAYESFSNNIIALLEKELPIDVTKICIYDSLPTPSILSQTFSAIVIGPGPGSAENCYDVGIIQEVWKLSDEYMLPVLGICLGFQSLVWSFGGKIQTLPHPRHGQSTNIVSRGSSIFQGLESFEAIQYHSLHAVLGDDQDADSSLDEHSIWEPSRSAPDLVPLAWDLNPYGSLRQDSENQTRNGVCASNPQRLLMAVRHAYKPFYGLQFHPESIKSFISDGYKESPSHGQSWSSEGTEIPDYKV